MRHDERMKAREEPLAGGMDNAGSVHRVGETVRRPVKSCSEATHALLLHLEQVRFDGAPRYLGTDDQGREVLSYIEGDAALPPYPAWCMTDRVLDEVAHLLRRFHEASASFDASGMTGWMTERADPIGGPAVCHNDVFPENVSFREGHPVALIDFDLAAPGRTL
jgi:phosphotransferase family enzyme